MPSLSLPRSDQDRVGVSSAHLRPQGRPPHVTSLPTTGTLRRATVQRTIRATCEVQKCLGGWKGNLKVAAAVHNPALHHHLAVRLSHTPSLPGSDEFRSLST